jgi:hypothetical protein
MQILTRNLFETGCQFQKIGSQEKSPLYIAEYDEMGHFYILDYTYACEYGRDMWLNLSSVILIHPEYFVFNYNVLGEIEVVKRYFNQYHVVNFKKHEY